jgi:hypothetical protein
MADGTYVGEADEWEWITRIVGTHMHAAFRACPRHDFNSVHLSHTAFTAGNQENERIDCSLDYREVWGGRLDPSGRRFTVQVCWQAVQKYVLNGSRGIVILVVAFDPHAGHGRPNENFSSIRCNQELIQGFVIGGPQLLCAMTIFKPAARPADVAIPSLGNFRAPQHRVDVAEGRITLRARQRLRRCRRAFRSDRSATDHLGQP